MKTRLPRCFILAVGFCALATVDAADIRLAIVPAEARCALAGELLTAEFSRASYGIAVLERTEVERIRREQNLTARSSADFARLGQALGAQGVLVLEVFEQKDAANLTVKLIAVRPGVALGVQSYPWPLKDVSQWAGMVGKQFTGLLPKLGVLAQDAVPLSVLNLRSPLKTSEGLRLENEATTLLINRLTAQPEIFVLERQRMTLLGAEKELKDVQESPFWNGSYLLEGVVERGGATRDVLTINARLVSPARTPQTVSVKSDTGDLNTLVEQLARDVISRLGKTTNAVAWNPAAEAKRYLEEARWGMRWGNITLAQAAADSAWALGEHSKETALIRVNSYNQAAGLSGHSTGSRDGFVSPPGQAFPQSLPPATTALENFIALTPVLGTNATFPQWREAGLSALRTATLQLWNFWHVTNEAANSAEALERLRMAARETEGILLDGNERPDSRAYATGMGTNIWNLKLGYGWVYPESTRASLDEFRRLLEGGTREQRGQLRELAHPWLMPWSPAERARADSTWSEFLDELARSTNAAVALNARLIGVRTSRWADGTQSDLLAFETRKRAADVLFRHRHELLCAEPELVATAIEQLDVLVRDQGRYANFSYRVRTNFLHAIVTEGECFNDGLLGASIYSPAFDTNHLNYLVAKISEGVGTNSPAQSRRRFLHAYLGNLYRWYVIEKLFRAEDYTDPAEARKMLNKLRDASSSHRAFGATNLLEYFDKPAAMLEAMLSPGPKPPATPPAVAATNAPDPNALVVNRWWQPVFSQSPTQELVGFCVLQTLARDGYVWAHMRGLYRFKVPTEFPDRFVFSERAFEQFFRIDPVDLTARASPALWREDSGVLLVSMFTPLTQFDVLDGVLYKHEQGKVLAWTPRETQWRPIDVALPGRLDVNMRAIGSRLYFGSTDTVAEFNPSNSALRVMASLRRNPPLVPEDRLPGYGRPVFLKGAGNTVLVMMGSTAHPWDSASGRWEEAFAGPGELAGENLSPDRTSTLLWQGQAYENQQLRRFNSRGDDELLFDIKKETFSPMLASRGASAPTARWKAPAGVTLNPTATAQDGTNLWCLDWPRRSLAYFEAQWEEPSLLPLALQADTMTNHTPPGMMLAVRFLPERNFAVLSPPFANGLWIIPQMDLDRALAKVARPRTPNKFSPAVARTPSPIAAPSNAAPVFADEAPPSDAAKIIRTYQRSKAGSLDMGELMGAIQKEPVLEPYRVLTKALQSTLLLIGPYDTNGTGRIEVSELDAMIKEAKPRLTYEELLARYDANSDGKLESSEFRVAGQEERVRLHSALTMMTSTPVRVGMLTFRSDDAAGQAALAVGDFNARLQAKLSPQPGITWVPREDVMAAEREAAERHESPTIAALRCGRRFNADWVMTGRFERGRAGRPMLMMDIIDVRRADVLEKHLYPIEQELANGGSPHLSPPMAAESRIALHNAAGKWETFQLRPRIALLTMLDAEEVRIPLTRSLESGTNTVRVLNFQQTRLAEEPELILLTEADIDASVWEKIADAYAWGRLSVRKIIAAGTTNFGPTMEMTVWPLAKEPKTFTLSGEPSSAVNPPPAEMRRLGSLASEKILGLLNGSRGVPNSTAREGVARMFFERAKTFRMDPDRWSRSSAQPEIRAQEEASQELRLLETACFFDPGLQSARERLTALRKAEPGRTAPRAALEKIDPSR